MLFFTQIHCVVVCNIINPRFAFSFVSMGTFLATGIAGIAALTDKMHTGGVIVRKVLTYVLFGIITFGNYK